MGEILKNQVENVQIRKNLLATLCFIYRGSLGNMEYLLLNRNKDPNHFLFGYLTPPGGKLELKETPYEGISRELSEETGYNPKDLVKPIFKGIVLFQNWAREFSSGNKLKKDCTCFVYKLKKDFFPEKENNEGTFEWVREDELLKRKIERSDLEIYTWIKQPNHFLGKIFCVGVDSVGAKVRYY